MKMWKLLINSLEAYLTVILNWNNNWSYLFCQSNLKREEKTAGTICQQSQAQFFNSCSYNSSTVTGTIAQQLLAQFFNSH